MNSATDHPGIYVKRKVIPEGMAVTKAAALMGIGRPALSNFLNGNSALSPEMALRLEKAFGVKSEILLKMQAAYDEAQTREKEKAVAVRAYAESFLDIRARQLDAWAEKSIPARHELPAFIRRLIFTTGTNLTKVDFPAYDNAQRHGWDGEVETDTATPWIPAGYSGWEFGCNENPKKKADSDYATRTTTIPEEERKEITFIFATPRNWTGKNDWVLEKQKAGEWKDVKALDASDFEQWLEQSVSAQSWIAEKMGVASDDIASLDSEWDRWAKVTTPELIKSLFAGAIETHKRILSEWLKNPPSRPLVVAAESEEEAVAFIAAALEVIGEIAGEYYNRCVVLRSVSALQKAARASSTFIPIIVSAAVEAASAGLHRKQHTIIVRKRNAIESEPEITLDLIDDATFKKSLSEMGVGDDDASRLERESGQSLTILRRRLSDVPAIKSPPWANDASIARRLIPLALAGVWNSETEADRAILEHLSGEKFDDVEKSVTDLLRSDHPPVWSVGRYRGVASKIDVLYTVHPFVTRPMLEKFFETAHYVLSENDPSLELPNDQRYAASIYGKVRDHSAALRVGLRETLILLAIHGNNLFRDRLGFDVEAHVDIVVRELLTPPTPTMWASQQSDLPSYAEASPDVFLDALEADLDSDDPKIRELLKPASSDMFGGGCPRSGLLWALETLAWAPERLTRVVFLLARISIPKIEDNWANKPEGSLKSIFRAWMPQTAANIDQRLAALERLSLKYPSVGWEICVDQFDHRSTIGHYANRPKWRKDASGAGQVATNDEIHKFTVAAVKLAINWPAHDERTLGDLVARLQRLGEDFQLEVWNAIQKWIETNPSDDQKATLRETIRRYAFTRRGKKSLGGASADQAREVHTLLLAKDLVVRHGWLFAKQWVEESYEELGGDDFDYRKREERINKLRAQALSEIWAADGYDGIVRLCNAGEAAGTIGTLLADEIAGGKLDFLRRLMAEPTPKPITRIDLCVSGVVWKLEPDERKQIVEKLLAEFSNEGAIGEAKAVRLLTRCPLTKDTWQFVDKLPTPMQTRYWENVLPEWQRQEPEELEIIVDRLLQVNRPRAALQAVHFTLEHLQSSTILRLLKEVATNGSEPSDHYRIQGYEIGQALKILDKRTNVSSDEIANLEFLYLAALEMDERGIPNLERQLAESPAMFMQAVGLVYVRKGPGEDPAEWKVPEGEGGKRHVTQVWRLLQKASRIPGTKEDGTIDPVDLQKWISEVRSLCKNFAREDAGDLAIGELLSKSKPDVDGIWPAISVRKVLEEVGSKRIADSMAIGLFNQRGAHFRGVGGKQERELVAKYRGWAQRVSNEYPFTGRLLEQIARSYERDAEWQDTDANLRKRLPY